jgi:thioredoxin 1
MGREYKFSRRDCFWLLAGAVSAPLVGCEKNSGKADVRELKTSNFRDIVLNNPRPVIVDFYAKWCGGCSAIVPKMEELSMNHRNLYFFYFNIDQKNANPITARYGIRSVPDVRFFYGGKNIGGNMNEGFGLKENLESLLERIKKASFRVSPKNPS